VISLPSTSALWMHLHVYGRILDPDGSACPYWTPEGGCPLWIDCPPELCCKFVEDKLQKRGKEECLSEIFQNPGWKRSTVTATLVDADYFEVCDSEALEPGFFCQEGALVQWMDRAGRYHEVQIVGSAAESRPDFLPEFRTGPGSDFLPEFAVSKRMIPREWRKDSVPGGRRRNGT